MKSIEELLRNLARPDVLEFGLVTNRLPSINIGGRFEPVDDEAPSTDRVKQMLVAMGGARFIESLSDKPVQWTTRLDGVGVIAVAAIMRKDVVQARFTVARRESSARTGAAPTTQAGPPRAKDPQAAQVAVRPAAGQAPTFTRTQQGTGAPQPQAQSAQAPPPQANPLRPPTPMNPVNTVNPVNPASPVVAKTGGAQQPAPAPGASSGKQPVAKAIAQSGAQPVAHPRPQPGPQPGPRPGAAPPPAKPRDGSVTNEWHEDDGDDDNEPTVQTLSPQTPENVRQPQATSDEPRPKPARRPEEVASLPPPAHSTAPATPTKTSAPPSAEGGVEPSGAPPSSRPAATATATAAQPAPVPREPSGAPPPTEHAALSSGNVADLDVEITTNDAGSIPVALADREETTGEHTVEVVGKTEDDPNLVDPKLATKTDPRLGAKVDPAIEHAKAVTGAMPSVAHSAVPSTTPSGVSVPEKDRPRVDAAAALDSFLAMAAAAHATDLHLVAGRPVLLRVASDLVARTQAVSAEHVDRIVREVMPPRLREMLDGDGACDFALDHPQHGRLRVNVSRHRAGTTLAIRMLGREIPSVLGLGLPDAVAGVTRHTQGLVLVTGPAGHGKSTTLAALVDAINADTPRHVYTIEDPIEYIHPKRRGMVTQREIGTHAKSWSVAIDDALYSDADVIVIGDLRDDDALRAMLTACEAGRLVFATGSCATATKAVDRIVERFAPAEQPRTRTILASAIRMVIGQRLVPSADRTKLLPAFETLAGTGALYSLVRDGRTHDIPALQQRAHSRGPRAEGRFLRLDDSLSELVRAQKVTLDVAKQFADSPGDLTAKKG